MRTFPITALCPVLALLFLAGCEFQQGESVPKEDYDAVVQAYEDLKVSAEATRDSYIEQATAVDNILQELSQITGSTAVLRTDLEQGTARLNQVEMIENSIDDIKEKLSRLDRLTADNAQYKKLVSSLKTVIAEKEKEIEDLKAEIQERDRTITEQNEKISAQHGTIVLQSETISAQREDLENAVRQQARMLYQAGVDFEQLGDDSPTVSRRKDKAKVKSLTLEMYEKALLYYGQALESGYAEAEERIEAVKEKMAVVAQ
jgi:chromosome segregation ATPase